MIIKQETDVKSRFIGKVNQSGECWEWEGAVDESGYGRFLFDGKNRRAHRVSFLLFNGPIPKGLLIRHKCDNRGCVNPSHLILGTQADNMRDMSARNRSYQSKITHCPSGHEYTTDNTYLPPSGKGRKCRICLHERTTINNRARLAREKEARILKAQFNEHQLNSDNPAQPRSACQP